uniref:Uncharacterized protein n=1 Tax=Tetranychus urticae TaxID=32264 RepID=T1KM60_TETUR
MILILPPYDPLDIPYVKMIEEKYRTGNKMNKTKSQEHASETFTSYTENTNNHHPSDQMSLDEGTNEINVATYQSESYL